MPSTATDRLSGLITSVAVKAPCRVATTAAITLSGLQTVNGVALASGDRVLVKDQADSADNGIYVADTGAWERSLDFNGSRDAVEGTVVFVRSGTTQGEAFFRLDADDPVTIGESDLEWDYVGPYVTGGIPAEVTLEDFGGAADWVPTANGGLGAGTDNYPALVAAIASYTFYPEFTTIAAGPKIKLGPGNYYFSQELDLKKIITIEGTASGQNNFIGGTRWYVPVNTRAITINTGLSQAGGKVSPANGTAEGTTIRGIQFIPMGVGTTSTAHAIWMRGRANVEYCVFGDYRSAATTLHRWPGNAINIVASNGAVAPNEDLFGNANNWRVTNCYAEHVKGHGLYISGTDVNAGISINFETRFCGGCGILDASGLGNTHVGANIAGFANYGLLPGRVSYGGRQYQLVTPIAGVGASTTPGTNPLVWYDMGADALGWTAWSGAGTYTPDIPILVYGDSNRSSVISPYVEGGGVSHIAPPAIIIAGQAGTTRWSGGLQVLAMNSVRALFTKTGVGAYQDYSVGGPGYTGNGSYSYTAVGSPDPQGVEYGPLILEHRRYIDGETSWYWGWLASRDSVYRFLNQKYVWRITGPNTTTTFGRASAVPYIFTAPQLAVSDPSDVTQARIMNICATLPTSGQIAKGERYWMNNASAGGFAENYCTTGGTIGSTAVIKTANPISA